MKQVLPNEYSKNSKNKCFVVDFQHFGLLNFFQCKIVILMIPKMIMFKKKMTLFVSSADFGRYGYWLKWLFFEI